MNKFKVPMKVEIIVNTEAATNTQNRVIILQPAQKKYAFSTNYKQEIPVDIVHRAFNKYLYETIIPYDISTLYKVIARLKSAIVNNQFDMIALNGYIMPMLEEFIDQANPDNYELEIIK